MSEINVWEKTVMLPNAGADVYTMATLSTNGYGVYLNLTRVDKDRNTHSFLLFPEQIDALMEKLPELYKQALTEDLRLSKPKASD